MHDQPGAPAARSRHRHLDQVGGEFEEPPEPHRRAVAEDGTRATREQSRDLALKWNKRGLSDRVDATVQRMQLVALQTGLDGTRADSRGEQLCSRDNAILRGVERRYQTIAPGTGRAHRRRVENQPHLNQFKRRARFEINVIHKTARPKVGRWRVSGFAVPRRTTGRAPSGGRGCGELCRGRRRTPSSVPRRRPKTARRGAPLLAAVYAGVTERAGKGRRAPRDA
jgi:hypothetical protein